VIESYNLTITDETGEWTRTNLTDPSWIVEAYQVIVNFSEVTSFTIVPFPPSLCDDAVQIFPSAKSGSVHTNGRSGPDTCFFMYQPDLYEYTYEFSVNTNLEINESYPYIFKLKDKTDADIKNISRLHVELDPETLFFRSTSNVSYDPLKMDFSMSSKLPEKGIDLDCKPKVVPIYKSGSRHVMEDPTVKCTKIGAGSKLFLYLSIASLAIVGVISFAVCSSAIYKKNKAKRIKLLSFNKEPLFFL